MEQKRKELQMSNKGTQMLAGGPSKTKSTILKTREQNIDISRSPSEEGMLSPSVENISS